jgi:PAS domain S-box-containing protein
VVDVTRPNLLLVDDSATDLDAMESLLRPLGHPVLRALSGHEALALLDQHDVACVLLDVQMSSLDGFDVARLLESQSRSHVPLLLLTELTRQEAHLVRAYSRGAVDYLPRPYTAEALLERVRSLLARHAPQASGATVGDGTAQGRESRAELERQRDRLHGFLMQSPAIINIFRGPEHTFDFVNTRFLQVLGERAFLGRTVREAQPELMGRGIYELLDRVYQTGEPYQGETVPVHVSPQSGAPTEERFFSFTYQPLRSPDGQVRGVGSFAFDVTEQVHALQRLEVLTRELRHNEEQLRLIIEGIHEHAIFLISPGGLIQSWNPGVQRVKGYTAENFIGRPFSMLFTPEAQAAGLPARELAEAAETGVFKGGGERLRQDGSRFEADVVLQALRDERGVLLGFVKVARDVTERKRAEAERERLLTQLAEAVRLRDGFLSIASHELKTPLTPLRLKLEGLTRALTTSEPTKEALTLSRRELEGMRRQVLRLTNLVNDILDVSRFSEGRLNLAREQLELGALVREVMERFTPDATRAGCELTLSVRGECVAEWDRARLEEVVERLLSNALKYGAGQPVELRVEHAPGEARLLVRDHGVGFEPSLGERIFDKFERASSERNYGGLGLGLFFTRTIVEALGGRITAVGAPGEGATFTVVLPL